MDRRQRKTREAIFRAFTGLLAKKNYHQITVQDILDAADVGRTTFYAHFETKEYLLRDLCAELFGHIIDTTMGQVSCACGDAVYLAYKRINILSEADGVEKTYAGVVVAGVNINLKPSEGVYIEGQEQMIVFFAVSNACNTRIVIIVYPEFAEGSRVLDLNGENIVGKGSGHAGSVNHALEKI